MGLIKRQKKKSLRKKKTFPPFPSELKAELLRFFEIIQKTDTSSRIAVFDLDNTLLIGDIGEAAIAYLLENEIDINFKWSEYKEMIANGKELEAYKLASLSFKGMEDGCVRRFADVVLNMKEDFITFFEDDYVFKVSVPRINPHMKTIINMLKKNRFKIYVISSSNQYLVETAAARFGLPRKNCFGIKHKLKKFDNVRVLSDEIIVPLPFAEGKVEIYKEEIGKLPPLFAAGDSITDINLLSLTSSDGFILWCGNDDLSDIEKNKLKAGKYVFYHSLF